MTVFVCPKCGGTDEQPLASRMWHWCRGRERELRRIDPVPERDTARGDQPPGRCRLEPDSPTVAPPAAPQGRLF